MQASCANVEKQLEFVCFCIEMYAQQHRCSGREAVVLFHKMGLLEYLYEGYESLHSQGKQWLLDDIDDFLAQREKTK